MTFLYILCFCITLQINVGWSTNLNEVFSWNRVEFQWPSEEIKHTAIKHASYIPENNVPLGIAHWKNKIFISIPRWKLGVASTLNYVEISDTKSPLLVPYPSWEANLVLQSDNWNNTSMYKEKPIGSVFRVWVDSCDRLWVLDNGIDDFFANPVKLVDKSILIFDLNTNTLIRRHFFKKPTISDNSFIGNIVVDVTSETCDDAFAYVADISGFKLIVYDFKKDFSWAIKHLYFHPDPLSGTFDIGGIKAHWTDGVLGLALSNIHKDGHRILYFHSLTSTTQFHVSTQVIKNQTWGNDLNAFNDYKVTGNRGLNGQSATNCYDEQTNVIFYTQPNKYGLSCWKTTKLFNPENTQLFVQNFNTLEFPVDIKIDNERRIWVMSNRLPKFLYGAHDSAIVNIQIMHIHADAAIKNSHCEN